MHTLSLSESVVGMNHMHTLFTYPPLNHNVQDGGRVDVSVPFDIRRVELARPLSNVISLWSLEWIVLPSFNGVALPIDNDIGLASHCH